MSPGPKWCARKDLVSVYSKRCVKFVEDYNKLPDSSCDMCGYRLEERIQLPCCHNICLECFDLLNGDLIQCPFDGIAVRAEDIHLDRRGNHLDQDVYCRNKAAGCNFEDTLLSIQDHELTCLFCSGECDTCGDQFPLLKLSDHIRKTCPAMISSKEGHEALLPKSDTLEVILPELTTNSKTLQAREKPEKETDDGDHYVDQICSPSCQAEIDCVSFRRMTLKILVSSETCLGFLDQKLSWFENRGVVFHVQRYRTKMILMIRVCIEDMRCVMSTIIVMLSRHIPSRIIFQLVMKNRFVEDVFHSMGQVRSFEAATQCRVLVFKEICPSCTETVVSFEGITYDVINGIYLLYRNISKCLRSQGKSNYDDCYKRGE